MGWNCKTAARPEVRRRSVPSNFAATLEGIPIGISGLEIRTSVIISKFLEIGYEFWNINPFFRMARAKTKRVWEQAVFGRRVERRMMAGKTQVQISDEPKPFILSREAHEPSPIPGPPTYAAHQTRLGEVSKS
jgi:hypothetical protein